ncbi:HipA domain-containing protein [Paenibacillus xylanexedens]|uniref:HipA domain-containing protein n=1 Tax=Paenibacillus xylanexedens TaxID=528191 RepID=UPI0011AACEEC|nr:HipA domain-containing protein [Paenibacillus xylanexedens]
MNTILDISDWKSETLSVSGSKEKRWYRHPETNKLVLFKLPVSLTTGNNLIEEVTGEMWSEKLASDIGGLLDFNVHKVDVGCIKASTSFFQDYYLDESRFKDVSLIFGALCHSFIEEDLESLIEGADMIMEFDDSYDRQRLKGRKEIYSFDLLLRLFSQRNMLDDLYKMIIFDTLIGNTDRHQDNFGIIRDEVSSRITFAPFYDNSSSLGRELPERRIELMFKDKQMFDAYLFNKKASPQIRWGNIDNNTKLNFFTFLKEVIKVSPDIKKFASSLFKLSDDKINECINRVPSIVMSDIQKEFVNKFLIVRRDLMLEELLR